MDQHLPPELQTSVEGFKNHPNQCQVYMNVDSFGLGPVSRTLFSFTKLESVQW